MNYRNYCWALVIGDSHTPARFWTREYYTQEEFDLLDPIKKKELRQVDDSDKKYIDFYLATQGRIKIVVVDEHTLGLMRPNSRNIEILHSSILKGSPYGRFPESIDMAGKTIRLASEKDFNDFRVHFGGFNNDEIYEYEK